MDVLKETLRCMRCGLCQSVCPVFRETKLESTVARGKVNLIRAVESGTQGLSARLEEIAYLCLSCQACSVHCPSGVKADELILEARARIGEARKQPLIRRLLLETVLPSTGRTELLAGLGRVYQVAGLESISKFFMSENQAKAQSILPRIPGKTLRSGLKELTPARGKRKGRVGYFLGCMNNVLYPPVGKATINILSEAGYDIVVPRSSGCCGMPHRAYGDPSTVREQAEKNVEAFLKAGVDVVITDCATCGSTLKKYDELLGRNWLPVLDISQFLLDQGGLGLASSKPGLRITYHDPCHLVRGQSVMEAPRKLLRSIEGAEFVEMVDAAVCCGGAGSFSLLHYDLSMKILDRKISNVIATGANVVATGCPACKIQLEHGLRLAGEKVKVVHPVELLALSAQK